MRVSALPVLLMIAVPLVGIAQTTPANSTPNGATTKPAAEAPAPSSSQPPKATLPDDEPAKPEKKPAAVSTMLPEEIEGFDAYPAQVQALVRKSLELTTMNLGYQFGSSDPKSGGMDCSGTIFRVLNDCGVKNVPRQSDEFCRWVMRRSILYRTEDTATIKDSAFSALRPGDLLFWTGTYQTSTVRELPVSHVMLYLGKRKKDGKPVIFGASDGRTYESERRNGVSIFDFSLPRRDDKSAFYGYGPVPGLTGAK